MDSTFLNIVVVILVIMFSMLKNNQKLQSFLASKVEKLLFKSATNKRSSEGKLKRFPISYNSKVDESNKYFTNSSHYTVKDLYDGLCSFKSYEQKSLQFNNMLRSRVNKLPKTQLNLMNSIGYGKKLDAIDDTIVDVNQNTLNVLIDDFVNTHQNLKELLLKEGGKEMLLFNPIDSNGVSNYRVVEALNHLIRDYSDAMYIRETEPLLQFIQIRLSTIEFSKSGNKNTGKNVIIVPGSGVGRIAHEIALQYPDCKVHSVEFSSLMYLSNQFVYACDQPSKLSIAPYVNYYSNHAKNSDQLKTIDLDLQKFSKPNNLFCHYGDFTKFTLPQDEQYSKIVVVTAFFIDTAENLLTYIDSIESFQRAVTKKTDLHWINIGPLKYGTKPIIQLTLEELTDLKNKRGWKDLYLNFDPQEKIGYITDEESMYKSYYSVVKFHSSRK